jgi:hypothetical protein
MWRGKKMGRSKVARFAADFFAAEIRARRPATRHHGASGAAGLVLPFSSRFLTGSSSLGWSFFYRAAVGGGISLQAKMLAFLRRPLEHQRSLSPFAQSIGGIPSTQSFSLAQSLISYKIYFQYIL